MEDMVQAVFDKWDLSCVQIGEVTADDKLKFYFHNHLVAEIPAESLVLGGGAPVYTREYTEPAYFEVNKKFSIDSVKQPADLKPVALSLLSNPNIASKRWVYQQYDSMVMTNNMSTNRCTDAAIVNLKHSKKALALTVDCNARYVYADPYVGAMIAVSEAARNITCSGGEPSAITNCLNFGNPYNPEVYWQFVNAIKGMGEACKRFETPVTGGNVSFYNQSEIDGKVVPVFPTPTIGMLGVLENKSDVMTYDFKAAGDLIYLLGISRNDINSSQYLVSEHSIENSPAPYFNLDEEYELHQLIKKLIRKGLVVSVHDVSEGGLFTACAESGMAASLGFNIVTDTDLRKDAFLFGESQSRVIVSVKPEMADAFLDLVMESETDFTHLGEVTNGEVKIDNEYYFDIKDALAGYNNAIANALA